MKEANTQFALRKGIRSGTAFTAVILYTVTIVTSIMSAVSAAARIIDLLNPFIEELQSYLPYIEYMSGTDIDLAPILNQFTSALMSGTLSTAIAAALPKILIAIGLWIIVLSAVKDGPMTSGGFTLVKVIIVLDVIGLVLGTILVDGLLALMIPLLQGLGVYDDSTAILITAIIINTIIMLFVIFFYGYAAKSLTRAREVARNGGDEDDIRLSGYVGFICIAGGAIGCLAGAVLLLAGAGASVAGSTIITGLTNLFFGIALFKCKSNLRRADILAKPVYDPPAVVRPQAAAEPAQGAVVYPQPAPGPYGATRRIVIHGRNPEADNTTGTIDSSVPADDVPDEVGDAPDEERPAFCPDCGQPLPAQGKFCPHCGSIL